MEVVGQDHITKTLKNQTKNKRIAHAYLFNGPRGTGKTSVAKILSRAVNCTNNMDGDPCNQCESCLGILDGSIMDVIEIDAASNNSVDNVRNIRDEIIYTPSKTKYKVYIIDEVHMLSMGAFNALLKTLEEPPAHVIFILATTEPQKLPATIISRCQRYDFKRISNTDIFNRLSEVTKEINIKIEDSALEIISEVSEGGLRDALSILDQCISMCDNVTYKDAQDIVGMVDKEIFLDISEKIAHKDISGIIESINNIYYQGRDIVNFITKLISHYRDLLVVKTIENAQEKKLINKEDYKKLKENAGGYKGDEIINIINTLSEILTEAKKTTYAKILLEAGLIKICSTEDIRCEPIKKTTPKEEKHEEIKENKSKSEKREASIQNSGVISKWDEVLSDLSNKGESKVTTGCLKETSLEMEDNKILIINVPHEGAYLNQKLQDKKLIEEIKDSILKVTGEDLRVKISKKERVEEDNIGNFKEMANKKGFQKLINEL